MDKKEGVTVKGIESFAKKRGIELILIGSFLLAMIFGHVFFRRLTLPMGGIGAILGVFLASRVEHFSRKAFHFLFERDDTTRLVLQLVCLILSIFLPFLIFLIIGLHGGKSLYHMAGEIRLHSQSKK